MLYIGTFSIRWTPTFLYLYQIYSGTVLAGSYALHLRHIATSTICHTLYSIFKVPCTLTTRLFDNVEQDSDFLTIVASSFILWLWTTFYSSDSLRVWIDKQWFLCCRLSWFNDTIFSTICQVVISSFLKFVQTVQI